MTSSLRPALSLLMGTALAAVFLVPALPAAAAPDGISLADTSLPVVLVTADGVGIAASQGEQLLDPAAETFTTGVGSDVVASLVVEAALPEGSNLTNVTFELVEVTAPEGGTVVVSTADGLTRWGTTEGASSILMTGGTGTSSLTWRFSMPGEYRLTIAAKASYAAAPEVEGEEPATTTLPQVAATYTVRAELAESVEQPPPSTDASSTDASSADAPITTGADLTGAAAVVLDSGDVRLASSLIDGQFDFRLLQVEADGSSAWLDPASTVLSLPSSEPWPTDSNDAWAWDMTIPSHPDPLWRTRAPWLPSGTAINDLKLSLDAGFVASDAIAATVQVGFEGATGPGEFTAYESPFDDYVSAVWSTEAGSPAANMTQWVFGQSAGSAPSSMPLAMGAAVDEAGVYCISLTAFTVLTDGTEVSRTVAFTLAAGVDPATVTPCAQPDDSDGNEGPGNDPGEGTDTVVYSSGDVRLGSWLTSDGFTAGAFTTIDGTTTWVDASRVVLSIPTQDTDWPGDAVDPNPNSEANRWWRVAADPGTLLWRTAGSRDIPEAARSNPLLLTLDSTFVNQTIARTSDSQYVLESAEAQDGTAPAGYFATYESSGLPENPAWATVAQWDSRAGGDRRPVVRQNGYGFVIGGTNSLDAAQGWAFSAAGVYCVTIRTETGGADELQTRGTYTVAAGVDPTSVEPCAQRGAPDGDGDAEPPALDPTVTYLSTGHTDLGLQLSDGALEFVGADEANGTEVPLNKLVWVMNQERYLLRTVEEPTARTDLTFIGEPGTSYWLAPEGPNLQSVSLWPGVSTHIGSFTGGVTYTLRGVSGPGEVVLFDNTAMTTGANSGILVNTRDGLPATFTKVSTHSHFYWAFTEPGLYCLNFEAQTQDVGGVAGIYRTQGQLTVAVGIQDYSGVQPCGRSTDPAPVADYAPIVEAAAGEQPLVVDGSRNDSLVLHETEAGSLDVSARLRDANNSPITYQDPENIVKRVTANIAGAYYEVGYSWDVSRLAVADYTGPITVALREVQGPGQVRFSDFYSGYRDAVILDSRDGGSRSHALVLGSGGGAGSAQFTQPGVYCVTLEWSGESVAQGRTLTTTKTRTYLVGPSDPSDPAYIDPATVVPCAAGGTGTEPGDEDPDDELVWDVPNGARTDSGAVILNDGHVDIASRIEAGGLVTQVKDTTDRGGATTYHAPAQTVLQLLPRAKTAVPNVGYGFLGNAGSPIWQVTQTQQDGLLWPGWSTEEIPVVDTVAGVRWALTDISGPGEFVLYTDDATVLGSSDVLFTTRDGITEADTFEIPKGTHAHGTWAFTAEGVYCLNMTRSTTLTGGAAVTDRFALAFAVGAVDVRKIDPNECFTEPEGRPETEDSSPILVDLNDDNTGNVQMFGGDSGLAAGQLVTVKVGAAHSGEWMSVWLHSTPIWLGWAKVDTAGTVQVRLPASAPLGSHKIVVKAQDGTLLGWGSVTIVKATTPEGPGDDTPRGDGTPPAAQVPSTQCVAGTTILSSGHIDYASRIVGGQLESLMGDDTSGAKVYREPSGTILWLKPSSRVTLPAGYGQVGAAGSSVWQVPQTQNPDLIWVGWSTEALNAGNTRGPVTWTINSISGPGTMRVYLSGSFGGVQQLVFDNGGSYSIPLGVHAHANWAFSAEGVYRISTTQTATLANGQVSSDTETLTIVVGNVDPASAAGSGSGCGTISNALLLSDDQDSARQSAEQAAAAAADAARGQLPSRSLPIAGSGIIDPFTALAAGNLIPLLLSILGALLLVGAGATGVLWWRRRKSSLLT